MKTEVADVDQAFPARAMPTAILNKEKGYVITLYI